MSIISSIDDFFSGIKFGRDLKPFEKRISELRKKVCASKFAGQEVLLPNDYVVTGLDMVELEQVGVRRMSNYDASLWLVLKYFDQELSSLSDLVKGKRIKTLSEFVKKLSDVEVKNEKLSPDALSWYDCFAHKLFEAYECGKLEIVRTPFQDKVLDFLLDRRSVFSKKCTDHDYAEIGESVKEEFGRFVSKIKVLYDFDLEGAFNEYVYLLGDLRTVLVKGGKFPDLEVNFARPITSIRKLLPSRFDEFNLNAEEKRELESDKLKLSLKRLISEQTDWSGVAEIIAKHNREIKSLQESELFTIYLNPFRGVMLVPSTKRKDVELEDLVGYDEQKSMLVKNAEKLLKGERANNAFIYGPPGTGKSSMVNAIVTKYSDQKLKAIEIPKDLAPYLKAVFNEIDARKDYKFIILIDEFDVRQDKELYDAIKKVMEGSFDGLPSNAILYVVSNYEEAARLGFRAEGEDDSACRALEDRFGLMVKFDLPDEETQRNILEHYVSKEIGEAGLNKDKLYEDLLEYCSNRKITHPNPRNIRDFVVTIDDFDKYFEEIEEVLEEAEN